MKQQDTVASLEVRDPRAHSGDLTYSTHTSSSSALGVGEGDASDISIVFVSDLCGDDLDLDLASSRGRRGTLGTLEPR